MTYRYAVWTPSSMAESEAQVRCFHSPIGGARLETVAEAFAGSQQGEDAEEPTRIRVHIRSHDGKLSKFCVSPEHVIEWNAVEIKDECPEDANNE